MNHHMPSETPSMVRSAIDATSASWAHTLTNFLISQDIHIDNENEIPTPEEIVEKLSELLEIRMMEAADEELEACCHYLSINGEYIYRDGLRRLRRPQPTLKSQALKDLKTVRANSNILPEILDNIETALNTIPD
jgi:hypothetical protein